VSGQHSREHPEEPDRVVIRDNRKIDPVTGEARTAPKPGPAHHAAAGPAGPAEPIEPAGETGQVPMVEASLLDERTADLQRLQAEYANYRKRADRERQSAGEVATGRVLAELLPVLDDLDRARQHGDLTGPLKAVADKLDDVLTKLGLEPFGAVGDPFDPSLHEAVMHDESDEVTQPTSTTVMRPGYKYRDRLLRAAMVGVTDPATPQTSAEHQAPEGDPSTDDDTPPAQANPTDAPSQ